MMECLERSDGLAVTLSHVKSHLRLETAEEDLYLEQLIRTATELCEKATQRTLLLTTYRRLYVPRDEEERLRNIELYYPPLVTIKSVKHAYKGDRYETIHRYMLTPSTYRPRITVWGCAVEVIYKVGYGDKPKDIPDGLRQAITMMVAEMYEKRTDGVDVMSKTVLMLLQPYRVRPCL